MNVNVDVEMDSWDDVRSAGMKLLLACRLPFEPDGSQRTGGWITSGAENGVVIELVRARYGDVNQTTTGLEQDTIAVDDE